MIQIAGRLATYGEVWLNEQLPRSPDVDVLVIRNRPDPVDGRSCDQSLTLVSDLTADADALSRRIARRTWYEIRRAEAKDALESRYLESPDARLEEFFDFYDAFAREKSLPPSYRRGLAAACAARQLVLTGAGRDGRTLVWHAYVLYGNTVTLLHSASQLRGLDTAGRALVGRANRWLHWTDMRRFRQEGLARYDWGGLFIDESVPHQAQVNRFKRHFGGSPEAMYSCTLPLTIKGRTALAASDALELVRKLTNAWH
ncbi:MAG TPA: GNAT family N-acetyltransferase [Burkholderiales bacterium]|nr:GNAT family N-acetyltransferase [Burkholderiales bacterium]